MPFTSREQALLDTLQASLPRFLFQLDSRPKDWEGAMVKIFDAAQGQIEAWEITAQILQAVGKYLDQHAKDRNTSRQLNETDSSLRIRLRTFEEVVTPNAILSRVQAVIAAMGGSGTAVLFEMRRDHGYFGVQSAAEPNPTFTRAFMSRGYRMARWGSAFVIILPYGITLDIAAAVRETVRLIHGGGIYFTIETRMNP